MLCTVDDQLALHRLNWQRLWSLQPDAAVHCIAWSSDGKMLAIGTADGNTCLIDGEHGDITLKQALLPTHQHIAALHWLDVCTTPASNTHATSAVAGRLQRLFSPPPPPTPPAGFQRPSPYALVAEGGGAGTNKTKGGLRGGVERHMCIGCGGNSHYFLCTSSIVCMQQAHIIHAHVYVYAFYTHIHIHIHRQAPPHTHHGPPAPPSPP